MKVTLQSGLPIEDRLFAYTPDLFNTYRHLRLRASGPLYSFLLSREPSPAIVASIHFSKTFGSLTLSSLIYAPFGGINCTNDCAGEELSFLMSCVEKYAREEGIKKINVICRPSCYDGILHRLLNIIYLDAGYAHFAEYKNFHIPVHLNPFADTIAPQELRRLKKCKDANFLTRIGQNISADLVFDFFEKAHGEKQYKLSISKQKLNQLFSHFPDQFLFFSVWYMDELIAGSICVRINQDILYMFLITDLLLYRSFSPCVLLYERIYNYCQHEGISILDQGICIDGDGVFKPELARFKKNVGGKESTKMTYQKVLAD